MTYIMLSIIVFSIIASPIGEAILNEKAVDILYDLYYDFQKAVGILYDLYYCKHDKIDCDNCRSLISGVVRSY